MSNVKRMFLVLLLVAFSVAAAGCIKADESVTIKEDGSSTMVTRMVGNMFAAEALKATKNEFVAENPDAVVKDVNDGDMTGYEVTVSYPDIETLAAKGGDMFTTWWKGTNLGIRRHVRGSRPPAFDLFAKARRIYETRRIPRARRWYRACSTRSSIISR